MKKAFAKFTSGAKYTFGMLIGAAYLIYWKFFLTVNVATTTAALQLKDSDAAYATGAGMATSSLPGWLALAATALLAYSVYKLFFSQTK
jgi:hypothetical protein